MATPSTVLGQVESLYVGYFGRAGDPSGVTSWVAAINSGKATFASIAANFAQATEATTKYPYLANPTLASATTFVTAIYANLFNRAPDAAGQTFWVNYLNANNGNTTAVGTFISTIITAAAAGGTDDLSVQNKVSVATDFTQQYANTTLPFNATAATQSTTELNATTSVASTVTTQIAATSAFIVVQQNTPTTFTALTTSADTINIAANGTQVTGTFVSPVAAASTFSTGDTINGNGFTNTSVLITDTTAVGTQVNLTTGAPAGATINNVQLFKWVSSSDLSLDTTTSSLGFSGLTALNVTTSSKAGAIDVIKAAATTAITVSDTANALITGTHTITGGSTVTFSENDGAFANTGTVAVTGTTALTAVSLTQTNIAVGGGLIETIADANYGANLKAGTITSVTINGLDTQGATLTTPALNTLSVSNVATGATVTVNTTGGGNTLTTATVLGLTLNNDVALTLADGNNFFKTLNVTEGATKSAMTLTSTSIATETVTGTSGATSVLTQTSAGATALAALTISGAASFTDTDLGGLTKLATVTDTSSGNVIVTLADTVTSFVGGAATGGEAVTIAADATKAITGAGLATSEVVFNNTAATFTSGNTGANVTGFKVLGLGAAAQGTYALNASPFAGYTSVDIQGALAAATILNKVSAGVGVSIDAATGQTVTYNAVDSTGSADSVAITLGVTAATTLLNGVATTAAAFTATSALTLQDSINAGIGTVSFIGNSTGANTAHIITALSDVGITALNLSGTADLTITNSYSNSSTGLTITDNASSGTAGLTFGTSLVDNVLTSLTLAGSNTATMTLTSLQDSGTSLTITDSYVGKVSDAALVMPNATTETFTNTGGTLTVGSGANVATALATLNLSGAVAYTATADAVTAGITVAGSTDNAAVSFTATGGAAAGKTDSFTLGNGANVISDAGVGTVNITVGTGANTLTLGHTLVTSSITEGTHTTATADVVSLNANGTGQTTGGTQPTAFATISGYNNVAASSDTITFTGDANVLAFGGAAHTAASAQVLAASVTDTTSLISWISAADLNNSAIHNVSWFQFGGNTYLVENPAIGTGTFVAGDTVVKLVGATTFANAGDVGAAGGVFKLLA